MPSTSHKKSTPKNTIVFVPTVTDNGKKVVLDVVPKSKVVVPPRRQTSQKFVPS